MQIEFILVNINFPPKKHNNYSPEKQLPGIIGQRDSLLRHLEVHRCRRRQRLSTVQRSDGLPHRFRSGKRFRVARKQIQHIAGGPLGDELLLGRRMLMLDAVQIVIGNQQLAGQR